MKTPARLRHKGEPMPPITVILAVVAVALAVISAVERRVPLWIAVFLLGLAVLLSQPFVALR